MTYYEVLDMPLRTFWSFNRQVDRLKAETDQRQLSMLLAAQSSEGAKELFEKLTSELGMPVIADEEFDEDQFVALQAKFAAGL